MTAGRLHRFVQFEFPRPLGPADGRYLIRDPAGEDPHHVLVLAAFETTATRKAGRWGRGGEARTVPAEVGVGRATLVDTEKVTEPDAEAWLKDAAGRNATDTVDEALRWLNFALRAHRAATADPGVHEVPAHQALAIRIGFGEGVEVADGTWTTAREVPPQTKAAGSRRAKREAALRPQERFAALLSGRDAVLACEELVMRARWDLGNGRPREAAMQAHLAVEAAVAELPAFSATHGMQERLGRLEDSRAELAAAANEALQGGPTAETMAAVSAAIERVEAALRARTASARY